MRNFCPGLFAYYIPASLATLLPSRFAMSSQSTTSPPHFCLLFPRFIFSNFWLTYEHFKIRLMLSLLLFFFFGMVTHIKYGFFPHSHLIAEIYTRWWRNMANFSQKNVCESKTTIRPSSTTCAKLINWKTVAAVMQGMWLVNKNYSPFGYGLPKNWSKSWGEKQLVRF